MSITRKINLIQKALDDCTGHLPEETYTAAKNALNANLSQNTSGKLRIIQEALDDCVDHLPEGDYLAAMNALRDLFNVDADILYKREQFNAMLANLETIKTIVQDMYDGRIAVLKSMSETVAGMHECLSQRLGNISALLDTIE